MIARKEKPAKPELARVLEVISLIQELKKYSLTFRWGLTIF